MIQNPPKVIWYEKDDFISIKVKFLPAPSSPLCKLTPDGDKSKCIYLERGEQKATIELYDYVTQWTIKEISSDEIIITLTKKNSEVSWPTLSNQRYNFVSLDWNKFVENDAESNNTKEHQPSNISSIKVYFDLTEKDTEPVHEPIELKYILAKDTDPKKYEQAVEFWSKTLTSAQKCNTLTLMWNRTSKEERKVLLKILIETMEKEDPKISKEIKGGSELLEDLDNSEYSRLQITYASKWVDAFIDCENCRIDILLSMFLFLNMHEKQIVCSTFI